MKKGRRRSRKKQRSIRFLWLALGLATAVLALCYLSLFVPREGAGGREQDARSRVQGGGDAETVENTGVDGAEVPPDAQELPSSVPPPRAEKAPPVTGAKKPSPPAARPPTPKEMGKPAVIVLVFDDAGQSLPQLDAFVDLPFPATIAVLPRLPYSREAADLARKKGKGVILHQPMRAKDSAFNPGAGAIEPGMSGEEIARLIEENLARIGGAPGLNNHEGSLITESKEEMLSVLAACASQGVFFLDSRTSAKSRAREAAAELGMHIFERHVFLDNTQKRADMLREFNRGLEIARRTGTVIMIGHVWSPGLPPLLKDLYPTLIQEGYSFATLESLKAE